MTFIELIKQPWPWYVAGPIIGLMVPALLIFGNKTFGISSSLRHVCAACLPAKIPFFQYDWEKEIWNLFFVFGIYLDGGWWISCWLWYTLCGWLHFGTCHHGFIQPSTSIIDCYHIFYGWWFHHGQPYPSLHPFTVKLYHHDNK